MKGVSMREGLFDNKSRKNVDCKNRSYFIVATYDDKKVIWVHLSILLEHLSQMALGFIPY